MSDDSITLPVPTEVPVKVKHPGRVKAGKKVAAGNKARREARGNGRSRWIRAGIASLFAGGVVLAVYCVLPNREKPQPVEDKSDKDEPEVIIPENTDETDLRELRFPRNTIRPK